MYQSDLWLMVLWMVICIAFAFIGYIIAVLLEKNNIAETCLMIVCSSGAICFGYTDY